MAAVRVAVVGAGIAGLAAAWHLSDRAEVSIFDPAGPGGKLVTPPFGSGAIDAGPDAFLVRVPEALDLCREMGIDDTLVHPDPGRTLLWTDAGPRPLPEGLVLGAPTRLGPVLRSRLLTVGGIARAAMDLAKPRSRFDEDLSTRDLIRTRFGDEVADRLVDPLVGAIHAGTTARLSAEATVPQLLAVARRHRSLLLGLRSVASPSPKAPIFATPAAGLQSLVAALVHRLDERGITWQPQQVSGVRRHPSGVAVGDELFDGVVLAVMAPTAAGLLGADAPPGLGHIRFASVALVTMSFPDADLAAVSGVNGLLVPRSRGSLMTACSFGSNKWPQWRTPGTGIVRISTGHDQDRRAFDLDDATLVDRLVSELGEALGRPASPVRARVTRWPSSFPQYDVGHVRWVDAIDAHLGRALPLVALAGCSYRGAGIPACIASGRRAADRLLAAATGHAPVGWKR